MKREPSRQSSSKQKPQPQLSPPKTKTKVVKFQKSDTEMKEEYITEQVEKEETTDLSLLAFGQMIENKFKQDIDEDSQDNYENVMPLPS